MTDLLLTQTELQKQALKVIERLRIKSILDQYGQARLVGSVKYGLMTWRDIDVDLVTKNDPTDSDYWNIVKTIFSLPGIKSLTLVDNRQQVEANRPKSLYLGVKYEDAEQNIWKIDIRLLAEESIMADGTARLLNEKMTDKTRETILQIKSQVHDNPKYHKAFSSLDIYEAVLLKNVGDLEGFKKYLSEQGKSL